MCGSVHMRGKPVVDAMPVAHQQVEIREVFSVDLNKKAGSGRRQVHKFFKPSFLFYCIYIGFGLLIWEVRFGTVHSHSLVFIYHR